MNLSMLCICNVGWHKLISLMIFLKQNNLTLCLKFAVLSESLIKWESLNSFAASLLCFKNKNKKRIKSEKSESLNKYLIYSLTLA